MSKEGVFGLVVIPLQEGPLKLGALRAGLRVAELTPEEFERLLRQVGKGSRTSG